ncbi:homeobox protein engrailed-2b-like [Dendronephthya gigantea]|uniref:homeobox protein engrailed-2b-like n=1 Tax=Dendronephthya gigantea TaxID=151771 RepID=UPI00106B7A48|nr:homeobox protein engrailed-2b-like [Dendronephthya gigantea]XP_028419128.1 homeobox protein engrailed-2b-like [Dendronephthya gigantea]
MTQQIAEGIRNMVLISKLAEMTSDCQSEIAKPLSDFSIDKILNGHFKTEEERLMKKHEMNSRGIGVSLPEFNWLKFTRYNPPKLPKSSKRRPKQKRKPGRNPRVPFTPKQLTTLENKFQAMKYLTNDDVRALCNELGLPENKIKIWFQNRRAREKRKTTQTEEYIDVMTVDGL